MALRNVSALCRACDAIANLSLGPHVAAQQALGAVTGAASAAGNGGVVPCLVGLLGSNSPLLMIKAARALGNVCQGHEANQIAAVQVGVVGGGCG